MAKRILTQDYRLFRSIAWKPWRTTFNIEFGYLPGEPCNCLARLPHWVYLVFTRKAHHSLEDVQDELLFPTVVEYWITRLATEYVKDPVYYTHLWCFSDDGTTLANDNRLNFAPTIWYDHVRSEIRTGVDYNTAKALSLEDLRTMTEDEAVLWMDGDWKPEIRPVYIDEHKTTRFL